jgi:hypothetical protein
MGGRVALYYAIYGQYEIKQLILESTSPGIVDIVFEIKGVFPNHLQTLQFQLFLIHVHVLDR